MDRLSNDLEHKQLHIPPRDHLRPPNNCDFFQSFLSIATSDIREFFRTDKNLTYSVETNSS